MKTIYNKTVKGSWQTSDLDVQYRIEETDTEVIITFQGSKSLLDWKHNFSFFVKPYREMSKLFFVHSVFLKMYKSVRPDVVNAIRHSFTYDKVLRIRGFSQGAALALLAHEEAYFQLSRQADTIVFGCPRVFSAFGRKELRRRMSGVRRIKNGGDIVTSLPPAWMWYKHYGKQINIGKKKFYSIKDHGEYRENL